jgi:hypothetical protein
MAIDKKAFWGDNYYKHPPLTDAMINAAETILNVKLPPLLLELLLLQNGGYTVGFAFPMTQVTSWADDHVPLRELFGIVLNKKVDTAQNLLDTPYMTEEWGLPEKQVLLAGDGHWWLTLDYRTSESPCVKWIDTELEEEVEVAASFDEFINGLVSSDAYAD